MFDVIIFMYLTALYRHSTVSCYSVYLAADAEQFELIAALRAELRLEMRQHELQDKQAVLFVDQPPQQRVAQLKTHGRVRIALLFQGLQYIVKR